MSQEQEKPPFNLDTPAPEFVPMAEAPQPDPGPIYDARDSGDMRKAAEEVASRRVPAAEAPGTDQDTANVERDYFKAVDGKRTPSHETVTAKRAAADLAAVREAERAAVEPNITEAVRDVRNQYHGQQPVEQQPAQPAAEQKPQSPSEFNDTARAAMAQEAQPQDARADKIRQVLEQNPDLRTAFEQEISQHVQATRQAQQVAVASLLASYPELIGVPDNQLQTAIQVIGVRDPARAQGIRVHLERTQALLDASQQIGRHQQAVAEQQQQAKTERMQQWIAAEDAKYEQATANVPPETKRKISENVVALAEEYGVSKQTLYELWQSEPLMHSSAFQRMMADAASYRMAQREAHQKIDKPVPPVQRPGVSQPRNDDFVTSALKRFTTTPTAKSGAALLMARRETSRR